MSSQLVIVFCEAVSILDLHKHQLQKLGRRKERPKQKEEWKWTTK